MSRTSKEKGKRKKEKVAAAGRTFAFLFFTFSFTSCRQDMHDQPKYRPLRPVEQIGSINDGRSARPLVEGAVARGELREDVEFYTGKKAGQQLETTPISQSQSPDQQAGGSSSGLQGFITEFPIQIT